MAVVVSGDTWTEERKHKKGWVENPECRWCSKLARVTIDTVIHRRLFCPGLTEHPDAQKFSWVIQRAKAYYQGPCAKRWQQWLETGLRHPPLPS